MILQQHQDRQIETRIMIKQGIGLLLLFMFILPILEIMRLATLLTRRFSGNDMTLIKTDSLLKMMGICISVMMIATFFILLYTGN